MGEDPGAVGDQAPSVRAETAVDGDILIADPDRLRDKGVPILARDALSPQSLGYDMDPGAAKDGRPRRRSKAPPAAEDVPGARLAFASGGIETDGTSQWR